jgi:hypothetical protein
VWLQALCLLVLPWQVLVQQVQRAWHWPLAERPLQRLKLLAQLVGQAWEQVQLVCLFERMEWVLQGTQEQGWMQGQLEVPGTQACLVGLPEAWLDLPELVMLQLAMSVPGLQQVLQVQQLPQQ